MKSKKKALTFKEAVEATPDIAECYEAGLGALGQYRNKVIAANTTLIQGSVDIDDCTVAIYPNANRWDYAICYNGQVYFMEVHSANTSEVTAVIRKLQWLKDWLHQHAPEINKLKAAEPYYWVQSKNFQIPKNSPQYRAAVGNNILPVSKLILN
jgi:hypothetical protein